MPWVSGNDALAPETMPELKSHHLMKTLLEAKLLFIFAAVLVYNFYVCIYIYIYIFIFYQILDKTVYISHSVNTFGKGMNPIILPPVMGR